MAAAKEGQVRLLFDFPDEILLEIIGYLSQEIKYDVYRLAQIHYDLAPFRATCKRALALCEPAWCQFISIDWVSSCQTANSFLDAQPKREDLVESLQLHATRAYDALKVDGILEMTGFLSRFPNLKYLEIDAGFWSFTSPRRAFAMWRGALAYQLESTRFNELKECCLTLSSNKMPIPFPFQVATFLAAAPKLAFLTIDGADLRTTSPIPFPARLLSLKELSLRRCELDQTTISAILSVPAALEYFSLEVQAVPDEKGTGQAEAAFIKHVLAALAASQPQLRSLSLKLRDGRCLESEKFRDTFDFSLLENLKHLRLWTMAHGSRKRAGNVHYTAWCPVNVFYRLPSGLERLQLGPFQGPVAIDELATALLEPPYRHIPQSLRLEFVVAEEHMRPLKFWQAAIDDKRVKGMEKFMALLSPASMAYNQIQLFLGDIMEEEIGSTFFIFCGTTLYARTNVDRPEEFTMTNSYRSLTWLESSDFWNDQPQPGTDEPPPARSLSARHYRRSDRWLESLDEV
ncbi:hypothetical protein PV04_05516 [Phialophora macrospora]|uniref:F-box domain-containing protein n=1 Tax=Phialophora macrospora TaxID=1851006 RepID=A0A0D2E5M4_9EURO|nr:hypothetical protein PV04_05516 [Phialophora macrospora]